MEKVTRPDFVQMPVHARRAPVVDLHPIKADVARTCAGLC